MNPLTNMKNVTKLSERELINSGKSSWHDQYRDSAWIFIGGLPFDLTEGDVICIFSQYGEIVNINLIRDKDNGKSKGFCFLCYEDQRSTVLAVDNLNGIKVLNRSIRVDHVSEYKIPKEGKKTSEETKKLYNEGCAPKAVVPVVKNPMVIENPEYRRETLADQIQAEIRLPARLPIRMDIKKEIDNEQVEVKIEQSERRSRNHSDSEDDVGNADQIKKKKKKSRKHSDCEDDVSRADQMKRKKKKKNNKKRYSSSDSSDNEKKIKNKQKYGSQSPDQKIRPRYRSESREKNLRESRNTDRNWPRNPNNKSKLRHKSRSSERQHSRNSSRDNKRYGHEQSNFERREREPRRRSRS